MDKYGKYTYAAYENSRAREILSYIGERENSTAAGFGRVSSIKVALTIHFQPSDGAKNHHTHEKLDAAFSRAAAEMFNVLRNRAEEIMRGEERDLLVESRAELEAALAAVATAKSA